MVHGLITPGAHGGKIIDFYIYRLEWSFYSSNIPNNSKNTTIRIAHTFKKISKAQNAQVHFRHLECEFQQNIQHTFQRTPNTPYQKIKNPPTK